MTKVSIHQLWKKSKEENMTQEEFKQLLIDNGVIINKSDIRASESFKKSEAVVCELIKSFKQSDEYK